MIKFSKFRLLSLLIAAILVLNQAVFLFVPYNITQAQDTDVHPIPYVNLTLKVPPNNATLTGQVAVQVEVDTNVSVNNVYLHWPGSGMNYQTMSYQRGNLYTYTWDTTASGWSNSSYEMYAYAECSDPIETAESEHIFVTVDNSTPEPAYANVVITNPTNDTALSGQVNVQVEVDTNTADAVVELFWPGSNMSYKAMSYQGGNTYTYNWDTTTFSDNEYQLQAQVRAMYLCISCGTDYYYSNTVFVKVKNSITPPPSITLTLIKPADGATISNQATVSVQVDATVTVDEINLHWPNSNIGQAIMTSVGNNEYQYNWDTTTFPDGKYFLEAIANVNGQYYYSNQITVAVENNVSPPSSITLTLINPKDGATVFGQVSVEVKVDATATVDEVNFHWSGPGKGQTKMTSPGKTEYHYNWYTTAFPDGKYFLEAIANVNGQYYYSNQITVAVENNTSHDIDPFDIYINFINPPQYISEATIISAQTNVEVDEVIFEITGPKNNTYIASRKDSSTAYYFSWDINDFPDGSYKIVATANKDTQSVSNATGINIQYDISPKEPWETTFVEIYQPPFSVDKQIQVQNNIISDRILQTEPMLEPIKEIADWLMPECKEKGIVSPEDCKLYMSISPECRYKGITTTEECHKFMSIPPECREKNLSGEECDQYMRTPWECREAGIFDRVACEQYMFKYTMPPECREVGAQTPEECSKILFINSMPQECREAGMTSKEECDKVMGSMIFITYECKQAGISTPEECKKYMMENFIPPECREAGVITHEECDYIMREKYGDFGKMIEIKPESIFEFKYYTEEQGMPLECKEAGVITPEECEKIMFVKHMPWECQQAKAQTKEECDKVMFAIHMPPECQEANITDPEECEKHTMLLHMPPECKEAGVTSPEECEKIMFEKHAPPECTEAGVITPEECEKIMFEKYAPDDCKEAGILTMGACEKYMFEKYGGIEEILSDKYPPECQKAGAKTPEECDKIMRKLYMPGECHEQGITDDEECEIYMKKKYMPQECREAGARTREECDQIMFKKYGPPECEEAGIEDEQECEEFMFNKYAPKVECQGMDDWQCKSSLKERHLGNIVAKQAQFNELKEKVVQLVGESKTVEDLEAILEIAREILPIKEKQIALKILAAEEELILNEDENLIQTAPIAVMLDSDQDGLSDDIEERIGTDPAKLDSDGDGYDDGTEVADNYNPLGEGELEEEFSSIEQAILGNETLGQAKTEGEISEDYIVENIINIVDETTGTTTGYAISGQAAANEVATLYIYSDLPLIATVQADQYGNWQYQLSQSLIEGEHEVYVALNDNTGRVITKSNPVNFFIKEAKAISVKDLVAAPTVRPVEKTAGMIKYYIIIAGFVIAIGISLFIVFIIQKKKQARKFGL